MADGRVIIEAILDTANVSKNVKNLSSSLNGVSWKNIAAGDEKAQALSGAFKSAGTACSLSLTAPVVAAGAAAFGAASNYEQATSRIQSAFGGTREEAEKLSQVGKNIYEGGWGASLDEVNDALIQTKSTLRDVSDEDLQTVTQNALMLSSTFGADVNESIRGTNALMEGFGLSATEASDLLTAGMQHGLNYTDELGDNLSEYSVRWGEAGMSASDYFSLLEAGTSNGAYNLDKVGDYLNEFLTSLTDGRMEGAMGSFSQGTQDMFEQYKTGGATAQDMLNAVLGDIQAMPNEYDRAAAASQLWSSLGEDNAMGMIMSLGNVQNSYTDVAGTAQAAGDAASDSFANKSQAAMRELQGAIAPLGQPLLNIATMVAGAVKGFAEWFAGIGEGGQMAVMTILGIVAAIGPMLTMTGNVIGAIGTIKGALLALKDAQLLASAAAKAQAVAQGILNAVMSLNPFTIIVIAVMALVGALVYLWNTNEGFRNAVMTAWNAIWGVIGPICEAIGGAISWLGGAIGSAWDFITGKTSDSTSQMSANVGSSMSQITSTASTAFSGLTANADSSFTSMLGSTDTAFGSMLSSADGNLSSMESLMGSSTGNMASMFSGSLDGMDSDAASVMGSISSSMQGGMQDASKSVASEMLAAVREMTASMRQMTSEVSSGIGQMKGTFSGASFRFPHIPMPYFRISGGFSLNPPSAPSFEIGWHAKGGVFNGPSVIGVGEAGPEAAVPLSGSRMRPFAQEIARQMPSDTGGNITINIEKFVHSGEQDDEELLRRIAEKVKRKQRAGGFA